MIISDEFRFSFVHIPKCAGTSVRQFLQPFDSRNGQFTGRVDDHPVLGQLDYVHIPLFVLREHFPSEFKAVRDFWSFALVRDPNTRFASSVSQRLKMYSSTPIHLLSTSEIEAFINQCIDFLTHQPFSQHLLPPEYIHFQRQIDYIQLGGEQVIDSVYTVKQVDDLLENVRQKTGQNFMGSAPNQNFHSNSTTMFRNDWLRSVVNGSRPVTRPLAKLLSQNIRQKIRRRVYVHRDHRLKDIFNTNYVRTFISSYYAADIALYKRINGIDL